MKLLEKLKELLGEEQFEALKEKFEGLDETFIDKEEVQEGKIPKERFDEVNNKYKESKDLVESLTKKVSELESSDEVEKIKKQLEDAQLKNTEFEKTLLDRDKNDALTKIFEEKGVNNPDFIKYKLGELEFEDGKFKGIDEKLEALKADESAKMFFNETKTVGVQTENKQVNNKNNPISSMEQIKAMSPAEITARKDEVDSFLSQN